MRYAIFSTTAGSPWESGEQHVGEFPQEIIDIPLMVHLTKR